MAQRDDEPVEIGETIASKLPRSRLTDPDGIGLDDGVEHPEIKQSSRPV